MSAGLLRNDFAIFRIKTCVSDHEYIWKRICLFINNRLRRKNSHIPTAEETKNRDQTTNSHTFSREGKSSQSQKTDSHTEPQRDQAFSSRQNIPHTEPYEKQEPENSFTERKSEAGSHDSYTYTLPTSGKLHLFEVACVNVSFI